ncbi:MAG TPA: S8 family serine peptidase, partial [Pyrinomonadaceae bacterium]|nr:S8 family serine peptidase [Pyrinomonadaceae bacterium]
MPSDEPKDAGAPPKYTFVEEQLPTALDPELQNVILRASSQPSPDANADEWTSGEDWVDVLAKLKDPTKGAPDELKAIQKVGDVVTGRVRIKDIMRVRAHENIDSLKGGRKVRETLDSSVSEIRASRPQLRAGFPGRVLDGSGVIVGVVDHDCDFAHPNFRNERGTRILYLWDQRKRSEDHPPPAGHEEGREFDAKAINGALALGAPQCYERLDYTPEALHGTQVLDIAAGSGTDANPPGVAPKADLIFVNVAENDTSLEEPLGNSRNLFNAVKYIFDKADEIGKREGAPRSVVVNISLNSDGGPHDGSTPFERGIDYLLQKPGRAVVMAAGNSAGRRSGEKGHVGGIIQPGQVLRLPFQISSGDQTDNKVEIWYDGAHELEMSLISPQREKLDFLFRLGTTTTIFSSGTQAARVFHRRDDPNNHDNQILIVFNIAIEPGTWLIVLRSCSDSPCAFHAWVETDTQPRPGFRSLSGSDDAYTIGSLACGYSTIAVGGYFTTAPHIILPMSSGGPTRDGRLKPEVSAPGANGPPGRSFSGGIRAAEKLKLTSSQSISGTSAAAPHVTGLIALLMQSAAPALLPVEEIRRLVINAARCNPPSNDCVWHPRFGMGRIDALQSLDLVGKGEPAEELAIPVFAAAQNMAGPQPVPGEVAEPDADGA